MVEFHLAKVAVAGSNPVFRSITILREPRAPGLACPGALAGVHAPFRRHSQVAKATVCKTVILRFKSGCRLQFFPHKTRPAPPESQEAPAFLAKPVRITSFLFWLSSSSLSSLAFVSLLSLFGVCCDPTRRLASGRRRVSGGAGFGARTPRRRFFPDVSLQLRSHDPPVVSYLEG